MTELSEMDGNVSSGVTEPPAVFMDNRTLTIYFRIQRAQTQLMPAICIIGFVANSLSLLVFLQPNLRRLSCSFYLAAKSVADFVFLATVFIIWLIRVDIHVFNTTGICQIVVFFSYLTAYISIWLAVALTVENLLCIWKPWFVQKKCSATSACVLTLGIVGIGIVLYQFSLWNNGVGYKSNVMHFQTTTKSSLQLLLNPVDNVTSTRYDYGPDTSSAQRLQVKDKTFSLLPTSKSTLATAPPNSNSSVEDQVRTCMPLDQFKQLINITTYIDSVITIFIPIIILAVTNTAIAVIAVRSSRRSRTIRKEKAVYEHPGEQRSAKRSSAALEKQASKFLFLVSVTLLVFHFPVHIVRLKLMLFNVKYYDLFLQRIFETLYYTHYAISFFVYLIYGSNFRRVFLAIITRRNH